MPLELRNLDEITREYMEIEVEQDIENDILYISNRLNTIGKEQYPELLIKNIRNGTDATLAYELSQGYFNQTESRNTKNGVTQARIPVTAPQSLAEGEFNRFYIRALCLRAKKENCQLRVYRARPSSNPRIESQMRIGQIMDADRLLNDLRNSIGTNTQSGVPAGVNSGLSVELINL